jgi:hypothetical protein
MLYRNFACLAVCLITAKGAEDAKEEEEEEASGEICLNKVKKAAILFVSAFWQGEYNADILG